MGTGTFAMIGGVAGTAIGFATGGPAGAALGSRIGATSGMILDAISATSPHNPARWEGARYGASIPRGWGANRTNAPIIWALRNPVDGSYIFEHNSFKAKLKGTTQHYSASFACLIAETGFTYADGTQQERPIVVDRIWMADQIVWQSASAVPIAAWSSSTVYNFGDTSTEFGVTYVSIADDNVNEYPPAMGSTFWAVAQDLSATAIDVTFHPGPSESTFTMAVDSMIATNVGEASCQAYRGCTYFSVNNMDLYFIGNAIPQNVSVEWHWASAPNDEVVFTDICRLCGLVAADLDLSGAANSLTGYAQTNQTTGQDVLKPMLAAKAYDMVLIDGLVQVIQRGGSSVVTIPDSDLSAVETGGKFPDRIESEILADRSELHNVFKVVYIDQAVNYREATATVTRNNFASPNPIDIRTGLVMTATEAAQMAGRIKDTEWVESGGSHRISLPGSYAYLAPTDPITLNYNGGAARFRIDKYSEVQNLVKLECVRDETSVLNRYEVGDDGEAAYPYTTIMVPTVFAIASISNDFTDQYASFPGFYIWANGGAGWLGAQVWYTFDAPTVTTREWVSGPYVGSASAFGTAGSALASASAPGYESSDSVGVTLKIGSTMALASQTQTAVNNGNAWALLGSEIVGLVTVSQTGTNAWTLGPGLVRGLRGSPFTGHASGDLFAVAANLTQTTKCQVGTQYIGDTVYVQALSRGQVIGDGPELSCVIASPTAPWVAAAPTPYQETPTGAINGSNETFGLSHSPVANTLMLFLNGSPLPTSAFSLSGSTITTMTAPTSGSSLYAYYSY